MKSIPLDEFLRKDFKKLENRITSIVDDVNRGIDEFCNLSEKEILVMCATNRLSRVGQYKKIAIYKWKESITKPRKVSQQKGIRIWFGVEEETENAFVCLVQSCDKDGETQQQTLDRVKDRLKERGA